MIGQSMINIRSGEYGRVSGIADGLFLLAILSLLLAMILFSIYILDE